MKAETNIICALVIVHQTLVLENYPGSNLWRLLRENACRGQAADDDGMLVKLKAGKLFADVKDQTNVADVKSLDKL